MFHYTCWIAVLVTKFLLLYSFYLYFFYFYGMPHCHYYYTTSTLPPKIIDFCRTMLYFLLSMSYTMQFYFLYEAELDCHANHVHVVKTYEKYFFYFSPKKGTFARPGQSLLGFFSLLLKLNVRTMSSCPHCVICMHHCVLLWCNKFFHFYK